MHLDAVATHFGDLIDRRQTAKITYPLEDILFVTLCSVIAGDLSPEITPHFQ